MEKRIIGLENYHKEFLGKDKRECAYHLALEIRQFEIELYWKRATYFWTLLAATFGGYFALASSVRTSVHPGLLFLMSCIGLVLSTSWYLVNRGSKYWQENWERHVDALENDFTGPIYKTTISKEQFRWWKPWDGYPFSVSKVNQLTSLFIALVWLALAIFSFPPLRLLAWIVMAKEYILAVCTVSFIVLLICYGQSRPPKKPRKIDFYKSDFE